MERTMRSRPRDRRHERGVALLLVLWIFVILGVLAMDFASYIRDDAVASVNFSEETRAYYVALAGMNRTIFDADRAHERAAPGVAAAPAPVDEEDAEDEPLTADGQWHDGEFAGSHYSVRMTDEASLISLNKANDVLLTQVITNLMRGGNSTTGMDRRASNEVATVVDSILDWRDTDNLKRAHGAESDYYLKRRPPYRAKNGFFDSPEELLLVRGVTPALFYGHDGMPGFRDVFSVYSRSPNIHIRTAPAAVLQALLGVDADTAADLVTQRETDSNAFIQQVTAHAAGPANVGNLMQDSEEPRTVLLEGRADTQAQRNQSSIAAVVDLTAESAEGARVIRWLDRAPWTGAILPGSTGQG
jgi:general secretion pathway protein K